MARIDSSFHSELVLLFLITGVSTWTSSSPVLNEYTNYPFHCEAQARKATSPTPFPTSTSLQSCQPYMHRGARICSALRFNCWNQPFVRWTPLWNNSVRLFGSAPSPFSYSDPMVSELKKNPSPPFFKKRIADFTRHPHALSSTVPHVSICDLGFGCARRIMYLQPSSISWPFCFFLSSFQPHGTNAPSLLISFPT